MAINPGPVPAPLIPFFRDGGGLKIIMGLAREKGTGLGFINQLRKMFPKDPRVTQGEYFSWLSYLNTVAKAGLQAGQDFSVLSNQSNIDPNLFPANYFIKSPNPKEDRYLFNVRYESVNPQTGQVRPFTMSTWFSELPTVGGLYNQIGELIQSLLDRIAASAGRAIRYYLRPGTLIVESVFRRF